VFTDEEIGEASGNCSTHPFINCTIHEILLELSSPLWHVAHRGKNEKFVQNGRWSPQKENTLGQSKSTFTVGDDPNSLHKNGTGRHELCSHRSAFEPEAGSCEHGSECLGSIQVAYPGVTS
jgi:hypothetical protein